MSRVEFDEETETDAIEALKKQQNTPRSVFKRESVSRKNRVTLVFAIMAFFFCAYIFASVLVLQYKQQRIIPYSQQTEEVRNKFPQSVKRFYAELEKYSRE